MGTMATLYLSAPKARTQIGPFYKDFHTILQNHIGPDYGIYAHIAAQIHPGIHVVVFDRDSGLQAEGTISAVTPKPSNRIQRYDIVIPDLSPVPYTGLLPSVNRCGVAFI
jgi:hypothetical protein